MKDSRIENGRRTGVAFEYPSVSIPTGAGLGLDLGCGSGRHRGMIEEAGYRWIGLDMDTSRGNARLLEGDACSLPFASGVFNLVWMSCVLEHVGNPWEAMAEVKRVTARGGVVVGISGWLDPDATHMCGLTQMGLLKVLSDVGLTEPEVKPATFAFPVILRKYLMYLFGKPEWCTPVAFAASKLAFSVFHGAYNAAGGVRAIAMRRSLTEYRGRVQQRQVEIARDFASYMVFTARNG